MRLAEELPRDGISGALPGELAIHHESIRHCQNSATKSSTIVISTTPALTISSTSSSSSASGASLIVTAGAAARERFVQARDS
jgi:hypothetical protein